MNSTHDLGGMHGFGPIDRSQTENFAHQWEQKVFGMTLACGMLGQWNLDQSRYARERMEPGEYLNSSYYEHWLHGLELLLVEKGIITPSELQSGHKSNQSDLKAVTPHQLAGILDQGGPTLMQTKQAALFQIDDQVRVRNFNPKSHTRAPRYIRGRVGTIINHHGAHIFPDIHSSDGVKQPAHLYTIRFEASEIWGEDDIQKSAVYVDVFEPYLEEGLPKQALKANNK